MCGAGDADSASKRESADKTRTQRTLSRYKGHSAEMQGGAQPREELRRLRKRQERGGCHKGVAEGCRRGAHRRPQGAPALEARRASSRQRCRHAAGHARAHAARALLLTTALCARLAKKKSWPRGIIRSHVGYFFYDPVFLTYNRNSHFGTRVVVVPGWCWDLGCQSVDFCDLCEVRDFCAELAVAPRGRTYSRFRPTTLDRAHHHRVRTFYRVRDALDHHRGGDKSAFSTRCDGGVQHQPSRLPAPRRGSPSGHVGRLDTTRPQTSHVSLAFCQLSARSRCCSRSRRASPVLHAHTCAAHPPPRAQLPPHPSR